MVYSVRLGPRHPPPAWLVLRSARRVSGFRSARHLYATERMACEFEREAEAGLFFSAWKAQGVPTTREGLIVFVAVR